MDLFQVTDVFGELVRLPAARWQGHILAVHPEMQPYLAEMEDAIAHPHCVYESESDPYTKLFYQRGAGQGKHRNLYLKVAVSYAIQPAVIKTAFFTATLTGGKLLWIKFP
jgi:hypothetical protein